MKIGSIDIGTNSMRLLVADYENNELLNRKKYVNTTRIGEGVDKDGYITEEAIERNLIAIKEFKEKCIKEKCEKIYCMGTSALRDSKNGNEFILKAKKETNIDVDIISGQDESMFGYNGVVSGVEFKDDILVLDIGGGSTEFIVGDKLKIKFSKSENVGALRMTEKFLKEEIVKEVEFKEMNEFIEKTIEDTINHIAKHKINKLIGIGGTITSLSAINQELEVYSMEKIHNSTITKKEIEEILQKIKCMTLNDKKTIKGLQEKRADIITAGVAILDIIMEKIEINEITVSEYDNLEGLICHKLKKLS